jgi:hypothetical protein
MDPKTTEFIQDMTVLHNGKYHYTNTVYINNLTPVVIQCPIHGEFEQLPKTHKRGYGCIECGRMVTKRKRSSNNSEFISKAQEVHGHVYDYSKVIYNKASEKVTIVCRVHGDFQQTPNGHLDGKGCRKCSTERNAKQQTCSTETFIEKAKQVHGDRYDYSKVIYKKASEKVVIVCPVHGDLEQTPNGHLRGGGCQMCAGNYTSTTEEFIAKAKQLHGDRYDYSNVIYQRAIRKVVIGCRVHGDFEQTPNNHLDGQGCFKCGHKMVLFSTQDFIDAAVKIHGNLFDYTNVHYSKMFDKVEIICRSHGSFYQTPSNHITHKQGCQLCAGNYLSNTEEFIEKTKQIHGDTYGYTKVVYINNHTKVTITCNNHGDFQQAPVDHLSGKRCPKCFSSYSKKQIEWLTLMEIRDSCQIQHALNEGEYKIPTTNYKADGYCAETNTVYEFHGDFYHGNPKNKKFNPEDINPKSKKTYGELYRNTLKKEEVIKSLGYNLVTIWESDWVKFNKSIKKIQKIFRMRRQSSA